MDCIDQSRVLARWSPRCKALPTLFGIGAACSLSLLEAGQCFAAEAPARSELDGVPSHAAQAEAEAKPEAPDDASSPRPTPRPDDGQPPDITPAATPTVEATEVTMPAQPGPVSDAVVDTSGSGLFEQSLASSDAKATPQSRKDAQEAFALAGYVRGDVFVGKVPGFSQGMIKAAYGELSLKLEGKRERYGDAFAEARLRYGLQGRERTLFVDLREAYVNVYLGRLDLRLGHQIIVWGRADVFNPTNNLTPFDLRVRSPVEDDRRLGNVGARAFLKFEPVRFEGVWLPIYSPAELPPIELDEFVAFGEPNFPAPELRNGLGALRVHVELAAFEWSASYLYGHAPLPGVALRGFTVGQDPPEVTISRTAYDHHVVGFDFSTAISDLLAVRGEAAFRRPIDYQRRVHAPRPDLQYVLGVDRTFGSVNAIAQYIGRYVFDWQREDGPDTPVDPAALAGFTPPIPLFLRQEITVSINEELAARNQVLFSQRARVQHLASLRLEWLTLQDALSVSALGVLNFTTKEWLLYPKVGYRISDAITAFVGGEIYVGPEDTLFGLIDEELSAGYAELRYGF